MSTNPLFSLRLQHLPLHFRLLFSAVLCTLGTAYLFAMANLGLSIGFTSAKVVAHYWGNETTQQTLKAQASPAAPAVTEEELSFDALEAEVPTEPVVAIPSFSSLVAEGHFHLFGYTFIFFLCGLIISLADINPSMRNALILAPFIASVFDVWSTLLTRFIGPGFSWMLMLSGTIMAASFAMVFFISMHQMWFRRDAAAPAPGV